MSMVRYFFGLQPKKLTTNGEMMNSANTMRDVVVEFENSSIGHIIQRFGIILFFFTFSMFFCFTFLNAKTKTRHRQASTLASENQEKLPIIYHPNYTPTFGSKFLDTIMSWVHPFDAKKYEKVYNYLVNNAGISPDRFYTPEKISDADLLLVHTPQYLTSLKSSRTISRAVDLADALVFIPNSFLQKSVLEPMRWAAGGTVLGAKLALEHGWAINLSGGYHHAKPNGAEGGCLFADIPLAIKKARETNPNLKVLIIDLDAHQGNGNAYFAQQDPSLFIFDMYNTNEYPVFTGSSRAGSEDTRQWIKFAHPLRGGKLVNKVGSLDVSRIDFLNITEHPEGRAVNDAEYLSVLYKNLPAVLQQLENEGNKPDLIIYNAGTDPYEEDAWGCMNVSVQGLIYRDNFVFSVAYSHKVPILMVLSGGYSSESWRIIAQSVENIIRSRTLTAST
jgi:histone deacetylase 11